MAYFTKETLAFLEGLHFDNDREWFSKNRAVYERAVKAPFEAFVAEMIERVKEHEPELRMAPKDAIFRINRDTRFSKDKSPYKTHLGAIIGLGGKHGEDKTGFYVQLSYDKALVAGGAYQLSAPALARVRGAIARDPKAFERLVRAKRFTSRFPGGLQGEVAKRIPPEFAEAARAHPIIANKQYWWEAEMEPEVALRDDLVDLMMGYYKSGMEVSAFLDRALFGRKG